MTHDTVQCTQEALWLIQEAHGCYRRFSGLCIRSPGLRGLLTDGGGPLADTGGLLADTGGLLAYIRGPLAEVGAL